MKIKINDKLKAALEFLNIDLTKGTIEPAATDTGEKDKDGIVKSQLDNMNKSIEALKTILAEGLMADALTKAEVEEVINGLSEKLSLKLTALGNIEKSILEGVSTIAEGIDSFSKGIADIEGIKDIKESVDTIKKAVNDMAEQPSAQRSFTTKNYIEKSFAKDGNLKEGERILSCTTDREEILKALEDAAGDISKGEDSVKQEFYKPMLTFEASGNMSSDTMKLIREKLKIVIIP